MDKPVEYEQTDSRWRNVMYSSTGNRYQTIGTDGCGPTCAAMVVATLRNTTPKVTPEQAADWSVSHGYLSPNDGTYWSYFHAYLEKYKIKVTQTSQASRAETALRNNRMVITSMGRGQWTTGGHFILAYGINGSKVLIHDPNSEASYREQGDLYKYKNEAVQFWIIEEAWKVDIRKIELVSKDTNATVTVNAILYNGENYIRLRDVPEIAPLAIGYENGKPTFDLRYK